MSMCNMTTCVTLRCLDTQIFRPYMGRKIYHHDNVASNSFLYCLLLSSFHSSCPFNPTYSNTNTANPNRFHANSNTIHPINYLPTFISPGPSSPRNLPHQLRLV